MRIAWLSTLLLVAVGACSREDASGGSLRGSPVAPRADEPQLPAVDPERAVEAELDVRGMTCSGCEYNVASGLRLVHGVLEASADHVAGSASVRYDPEVTTLEALAAAVTTTGYEARPVESGSTERASRARAGDQ